MTSDEAICAVITLMIAARKYAAWARETGDYPHDEAGCRAHEALLAAVRALDKQSCIDPPPESVGGIDRTPSPWWKS